MTAVIEQTMVGKRILLGITGGIAAYKSAALVRRLTERGAEVRVVMTPGAQAFITPLTFQAVSGNPVHTELLDERAEAGMGHIELARWADHVLIAPCSADFMARLAHGMANDLLATVCLATTSTISLAPAMNAVMWANPATQSNAQLLTDRGIELLGPASGEQACGEFGSGRMLEPEDLVGAIASAQSASSALDGMRVLVTAGPTYEDIDPVRYLGNRSSGKMGFAVAAAAQHAGASVTLVAGPVSLSTPPNVARVDVRTAQQMQAAVMDRVADCDIYISAAAVADFRPLSMADQKIKKTDMPAMTVELCRNPDILAEVAALPAAPFTVGFAAETDTVEAHALDKLRRKRLDMICANQVGLSDRGFDTDRNALTVIWSGGQRQLPCAGKQELARQLIELIAMRQRQQQQQGKQAKWNEKSA